MAKKAIRPIRIEGNVAYVPLTRGYEAIIDAADVHLVEGFNWTSVVPSRRDGTVYTVYAARRTPRSEGPQRGILMHRVIMNAAIGCDVDHINGDGFDNRRANLRASTKAQNAHNRPAHSNSKSGIKGVYWDKQSNKWLARIMANGRRHCLGSFESVDDAAEAYRAASNILHREFGRA